MKTLLTFGVTVLMSLACLAGPSGAREWEDPTSPMEVADILMIICNQQLNRIPDVSCAMSIKHWSMDLILPVGNVPMMELEEVAEIFCKVGDVLGREPTITVNRMRRVCGGIEV